MKPIQPGVRAALACAAAFAALPTASVLVAQDASGTTLTLETPREMRFETSEGTWMSIDVSPDGRTLVFDLLGDLYTLPIEGGVATRITGGQGFDATPKFSPDGGRIAFVSDRSGALNLWVANADGSAPSRLSSTEGYWVFYTSPVWSADGRTIVVSRNDGPAPSGLSSRRPTPFSLVAYSLDGGMGQKLTTAGGSAGTGGGSGGGESHLGPRFASDGTLWYSTSGERAQIRTLDPRTGESRARLSSSGGAIRPLPSPDGRWLVYGTRRGDLTALRLLDLETDEERWLAEDVQRDEMAGWPTRDLLPGMAFLPDGSAIVAAHHGKIWRIAVPSGEATEIPFTATIDQRIAASSQFQYPFNDSTLDVRQIRNPRLSPDGRRVAFVALDRIWVADLPGGLSPGARATATAPRRLTDLTITEAAPTWSPDGRTIAFVTWDDSTGGDVFRVPANGGRPVKLSRIKAFYEKLVYTPDGSRLLLQTASRATRFEHNEGFTGAAGIVSELMWMPAEGGTMTRVTEVTHLNRLVPPYHGIPHFGTDPERILLYDAPGDGLYSMDFEGGDRTLLIRGSQRPWNAIGTEPAEDIVLSPTGRHAALLGMQQVFLTKMPGDGFAPSVSLLGAGGGSVPTTRLTTIGGNFPAWSADGRILTWAFGSTLYLYDVLAADSVAASGDEGASYAPIEIEIAITVPRDRPRGAVILRGARIVTMRGDEVIERGDVVIEGNRIAAVGPTGSVPAPPDATVIDVTGKTILPGFVDTHAHMGGIGWGVHRTEPWQYYANLAYGVTSTRDPQTLTTDVLDYADRVETGDIVGPRIFTTARAVFAADPVNSLDDARNILRRYSDFWKTETVKLYVAGTRQRRQWLMRAAQELRLSPTNEGDATFMLNLTHMLDGYAGNEHTFPVYPIFDDVVQLAVHSGTTYTPVLTIAYGGPGLQEYFTSRFDFRAEPKLRRFWPRGTLESRMTSQWRADEYYAFPEFAAGAAEIAAAGGKVAVGSHGNLQGIGYHLEMWGLAMGGMPAHEVLRSATVVGAEAIGHLADLGSIEPGKLADLLILGENPLEDIRRSNTVEQVMKNGRLYEAETLDEVWPRQRAMPVNQWWMAPERQY